MSRSLRRIFLGALLVAGGGFLTAQSGELTVEQLYLRNIEFQVLRERAFATDPNLKTAVLVELATRIEQGLGSNEQFQIEFILEYLAMEGITQRLREGNRLINNHPEIRREAAKLLGEVGGERAKDALVTVLLRDTEPIVRSEAAFSLGKIGLNTNNEVVEALSFTMIRMNPAEPDNGFAYASVVAIERIAQQNNGITDPAAFEALIKIAQGSYYRSVRNKALQVLADMKNYQ